MCLGGKNPVKARISPLASACFARFENRTYSAGVPCIGVQPHPTSSHICLKISRHNMPIHSKHGYYSIPLCKLQELFKKSLVILQIFFDFFCSSRQRIQNYFSVPANHTRIDSKNVIFDLCKHNCIGKIPAHFGQTVVVHDASVT